MRKICLLVFMFFLSFEHVNAQSKDKEGNKKEQKEDKNPEKKEATRQSFGELAEESGKRIWTNLKGFFNVVAEDVIEKKDKFKKTEKPKEKKPKEKGKTVKEKESKTPTNKDEPK
ncbi:MAG: hypothetical protein GY816_15485 [Cytophagales bacterium]|nr:hypothetical protein [Cytophagales bacterium]